MNKFKTYLTSLIVSISLFMVPVYAEPADGVADVIKQAWESAKSQIITVVNDVVFPILDLILVVFFFVKLSLCYFDYRKSGMFDWTGPAILFVCLCFTLIAPNFIWTII